MIFSKSWKFFGFLGGIFRNSLGIFWEFFGNSLGILREFFGNSLGLWEFFGNSLGILWEFSGILWDFFENSFEILREFMTLSEMNMIFEFERGLVLLSRFCLNKEGRGQEI